MARTELLKELDLMPEVAAHNAEILVTIFSENLARDSASLAFALRESGLAVELSLDPTQRLDRQLKYADRKGIPFVAILGPDDLAGDSVVVKSMIDGTQSKLPAGELEQIKSHVRRGVAA